MDRFRSINRPSVTGLASRIQ